MRRCSHRFALPGVGRSGADLENAPAVAIALAGAIVAETGASSLPTLDDADDFVLRGASGHGRRGPGHEMGSGSSTIISHWSPVGESRCFLVVCVAHAVADAAEIPVAAPLLPEQDRLGRSTRQGDALLAKKST